MTGTEDGPVPEHQCGPECDECRAYNDWLALLTVETEVDWAAFAKAMNDQAQANARRLTDLGHDQGWLPDDLYLDYGPVIVGERGRPVTALPLDDPSGTFTCPACGITSHHPKDRQYGYCGRCHAFTGPATDG